MDKKLSIIVPVYNVDKYLVRCLESLVAYSPSNSEVILIDDGSTDDSGKICDEYSKKYDNIIVQHKKNEGQAIARNIGLDLASGEYVSFIDSDDYVNESYKKVEKYLNDKIDILCFGWILEMEDGTKVVSYKQEEFIEGNNQIIKKCAVENGGMNSVCFKIIRKEFLNENNLRFRKGYAEDYNLSARSMCYANTCKLVPIEYYHYITYRQGSTMHTYKKSRFYEFIDQSKSVWKCTNVLNKQSRSCMRSFIGRNVLTNFILLVKLPKEDQDEILKLFKDNKHLISEIKGFKFKCFLFLCKIFGYKFVFKVFLRIFKKG